MAVQSRPLPQALLVRERQVVTRFQELTIRKTFRFSDLPAEIRNIIYDLCLDLSGVEKYFDKYYALLKHCKKPNTVKPPRRHKKTPTILLLNRPIFCEAVTLLPTKSINFHHGLLDIKGTEQLVSSQVLRNISAISITTKGHPLLKKNILKESWCGYMDLFTKLAHILSDGHKLKRLDIHFGDHQLTTHTTLCWDSTIKCDFRNHIQEAFGNLRGIRNVGCVTITGIPAAFAHELKLRIESKPKSFLDLPGELRNEIYGYCGDYADISIQVARTMENWTDKAKDPPYPKRSTPKVLFLNKQIYKEAAHYMRCKTLDLILPYDRNMQKQNQVPNMLQFIKKETLQKVKHLSIKIESWEWVYSLDRFLPALAERHELTSLHVDFTDSLKNDFLRNPAKKYPDSTLHLSLSGFAKIRGLTKATFSGDLPDVYTVPLVQIMQSAAGATGLPTLKAIRGNGAIVEADEEDA